MFQKMWPYMLVCTLIYYVPFIIMAGFSMENTGLLMLLLLAVMPMTCLIVSAIFADRHKFHLLLSIILAVLFIPAILFFMDGMNNSSGWIYVPAYFVVSLTGSVLGNSMHWKK